MWLDSIKSRLLTFAGLIRRLLPSILLLPVSPLLMWGPVTHLYLSKRAIDKIKSENLKDEQVKKVLETEHLRNIFINAGNAVDLIKANNLRNRERFFEYAHNTVPNYFTGDPVMGRFLLEEVKKLPDGDGKDERFAWSLGWLSHQVCDGFAHKVPHAGFEGWVNSRRILAGHFSPETEDESVSTAQLRIQLYMADHWLAELLVDTLCLAREREFIESFEIDFSVPTDGEVYTASKRILENYAKKLGPAFVYFQPLEDDKLRGIVDFYELIVHSIMHVYRAILNRYSAEEFERYISSSPRLSRVDDLLNNSVDAIVHMLEDPENPWKPEMWLGEGENKFEYSVYEYERTWRPGRYKFGRKTGLLGALYYNGTTDWIITKMRDVSRRRNMWPLIRLIMAVLYGRGKSQWPISSVFIRTLISEKPVNVPETMERVARICGLEKYEEIVPD